MAHALPPLDVQRRNGDECFTSNGNALPQRLISFWQWYGSDLVNNALRGALAEYIVAMALDIAGGVRTEWDAYDLVSRRGTKIEIKSSGYCQSWGQPRHSAISFGVAPTRAIDWETNRYDPERKRQADVYVFCVLHHRDKPTVDPLRLEQWSFYLITRKRLDEGIGSQASLSLSGLKKLHPVEACFETLPAAFERIECAHTRDIQARTP